MSLFWKYFPCVFKVSDLRGIDPFWIPLYWIREFFSCGYLVFPGPFVDENAVHTVVYVLELFHTWQGWLLHPLFNSIHLHVCFCHCGSVMKSEVRHCFLHHCSLLRGSFAQGCFCSIWIWGFFFFYFYFYEETHWDFAKGYIEYRSLLSGLQPFSQY